MKAEDARLGWNPETKAVEVGPRDPNDWMRPYPMWLDVARGGAYQTFKPTTPLELAFLILVHFHTLAVRDRIPLEPLHREFLKIDEYRQRISPDIDGAEHD